MPTSLPSSTASGTPSATSLPSNMVSGTPSVPAATSSLPSNAVSGTPSAKSLPSNVVSGTPSASGADTTAPVTNTLTFNGTTGTLTWTETQTPPVLQVMTGPAAVTTTGGATESPSGNSSNAVMSYVNSTQYSGTDAQGAVCKLTYATSNVYGPGVYHWQMIVGATFAYYNTATSASATPPATFPTTGWVAGNMVAPVPTFSYSASSYATNQGLTITGLSGGAVTVSGVTTSGTTTTFTTSRVISFMETSGTFSGVAGAFSDSVSTPNLTAAFSILITRSMFPTARIVNCTTVIMF